MPNVLKTPRRIANVDFALAISYTRHCNQFDRGHDARGTSKHRSLRAFLALTVSCAVPTPRISPVSIELSLLDMTALDSREPIPNPRQPQREEKEKAQNEQTKERCSFTVAFIEDSSVHVRDALGHEVAFEFPLGNVSLEDYDKFVQQMQNDRLPPAVEDVKMSIRKPLVDASRGARAAGTPNSATSPYSWEQHAEYHGISVDEIKAMYFSSPAYEIDLPPKSIEAPRRHELPHHSEHC